MALAIDFGKMLLQSLHVLGIMQKHMKHDSSGYHALSILTFLLHYHYIKCEITITLLLHYMILHGVKYCVIVTLNVAWGFIIMTLYKWGTSITLLIRTKWSITTLFLR
jgi:hypothetical protein